MADLRRCKTCGTEKPLAEFPTYQSGLGTKGRRHKCRVCWNARWTPTVVACNRRHYHENINGYREKHLARVERRRVDSPEKIAAALAVKEALRTGALVAKPCEVCGIEPADAHHDDYSKPLDVLWLCRSHHGQRHGLIDRGTRAEDWPSEWPAELRRIAS